MSVTITSKFELKTESGTATLSKDAMVPLYQLLLANVTKDRDYSNVTSVKKLAKCLELELVPDDSDDESDGDDEAPPPPKKEPEPVKKAPVQKKKATPAVAKPVEKQKSDPAKNDDNDGDYSDSGYSSDDL